MKCYRTTPASDGSALQREVPKLLDALVAQNDKLWIAPSTELERWWRARGRVTTQVLANGNQLTIQLAVRAPGNVRDAQVIVFGPTANKLPKVTGPIPFTVVKLDEQRSAIVFAELKTGNYTLKVNF